MPIEIAAYDSLASDGNVADGIRMRHGPPQALRPRTGFHLTTDLSQHRASCRTLTRIKAVHLRPYTLAATRSSSLRRKDYMANRTENTEEHSDLFQRCS
jgi:hypothetical protein